MLSRANVTRPCFNPSSSSLHWPTVAVVSRSQTLAARIRTPAGPSLFARPRTVSACMILASLHTSGKGTGFPDEPPGSWPSRVRALNGTPSLVLILGPSRSLAGLYKPRTPVPVRRSAQRPAVRSHRPIHTFFGGSTEVVPSRDY